MSINKVLISGNLTRDPELRATASGMPVLGLGVAVNDRRKNQSTGEWEDFPNFIDCTMFGARAESVKNFLSKGSKVAIEGKLRWSQWERDGQKRSKIEVIIDEIEFLSARDGSSQSPQMRHTEIPEAPEITVYDEDIPF
jgi:single-strand DNA-binding protein